MKTNLLLNKNLLGIIGRRFPAIYDLIRIGPENRYSIAALNPQPLPPHEIGIALAAEFIRGAFLADRLGIDPGRLFADLDDWCPTKPGRLKLPPWWPPIPEPDPHPNWFVDLHLGFASRLAAVEGAGARLGKLIDKAIDRSLSAIDSVKPAPQSVAA